MVKSKGWKESGADNKTGGCIINVASLLGLKGGKGSAAYAASKAGVIGKSSPNSYRFYHAFLLYFWKGEL